MKPQKSSYPPFNIATSFLLVIFIVLCMVVFAVLSLSNAVKDRNLSEKNAARTTAYYEAGNRAEEILAVIDQTIAASHSLEEAQRNLEQLDELTVTSKESTLLINYAVPIDDSEILEVSLETSTKSADNLIIRSWKQHSTNEWTGDTSLPVLGRN